MQHAAFRHPGPCCTGENDPVLASRTERWCDVSTSLTRLGSTPEDYQRIGIKPDQVLGWEDAARTDGGAGTWEWWYFDANLDDGAKLVVVFYTKSPQTEINRPLAPMIRIDLD